MIIFFSKYQCGFRKGYREQHYFLFMIQKWKTVVDNGDTFGALWTDLSKDFDCILHDLIISKLEPYSFQIDGLRLVYDYLPNKKQKMYRNDQFLIHVSSIYIYVTFFITLTILILQGMRMIPSYILQKKTKSLLLMH